MREITQPRPILRQWSFYFGMIVPPVLVVVLFETWTQFFVFHPLICIVGFPIVCTGLAAAALWKQRKAFATGLLISTPITFVSWMAFLIWAFGQATVK